MAESSSGLSIIPDAYKAAYNLVAAAYYGDPWTAQNLSRPLIAEDTVNPTPSTPATHWYGVIGIDAAWVATFGPGASLPTTNVYDNPISYPLMDGQTELLSEEDAQAAWEQRIIYTVTMEGEPAALADQLKATAFPALDLIPRPEPEI